MNFESYLAIFICFLIILFTLLHYKVKKKIILIVIIGLLLISGLYVYRITNTNIPYIDGPIQTNIPKNPIIYKKPIQPEFNTSKQDVYNDAKRELDSDIESYTGANKK